MTARAVGCPARIAGGPPNAFDARVEGLICLGDSLRVRCALCGVTDFMLRVGNVHGHKVPAIGETIRVGWRAEDALALDAS